MKSVFVDHEKLEVEPPEVSFKNGELNVNSEIGQFSPSDIYQLFMGVSGNESFNYLLSQALDSFNGGNTDESMNIILQFLRSVSPRDALEGMLAVQMITAHNMSVEMASRATNPENSFEINSENFRRTEKLMKTFSAQMEALQKYRKKGQQTIQVQHVNVESGGQAIVGNVGGKGS